MAASVGVAPTSGLRNSSTHGVEWLLDQEMSDMKMTDDKDMEAAVVDGNGTETGSSIVVTTIDGRNGQPKQTISYMAERVVGQGSFGVVFQTISYMAERVVGPGSFRVVFQKRCLLSLKITVSITAGCFWLLQLIDTKIWFCCQMIS